MRSLASLSATALFAVACQRDAAHAQTEARSFESVLLVLPGAQDLARRAQGGAVALRYDLAAPFPAAAQVSQIAQHMEKTGWKPLREDWLNPGIPTSLQRGWTSFIDATHTPRLRRYAWHGEWENTNEDLAEYSLSYELSPGSDLFPGKLSVQAAVMPAQARHDAAKQVGAVRERERASPQLPAREEGLSLTVEEAKEGDSFLLSNHRGEAVVQISGVEGNQVSYRWRFRPARGEPESQGASLAAASIQPGPFQLVWMPQGLAPEPGSAGVGFYHQELDLIALPSSAFEKLDLAAVHQLAASLTDRIRRFAEFRLPSRQAADERISTFFTSGKSMDVHLGQVALFKGIRGSAVLELEPGNSISAKVKYHWRFRPTPAGKESRGEGELSDSPRELLGVGPYEVQCERVSITTRSDAQGKVVTECTVRITFLPEEVTVIVVPQSNATTLDLATPSDPATRSSNKQKSQ